MSDLIVDTNTREGKITQINNNIPLYMEDPEEDLDNYKLEDNSQITAPNDSQDDHIDLIYKKTTLTMLDENDESYEEEVPQFDPVSKTTKNTKNNNNPSKGRIGWIPIGGIALLSFAAGFLLRRK